jgi:hypothetical protein
LRTWSTLYEERPLRRLHHLLGSRPEKMDLIVHRATRESGPSKMRIEA